MAVITGLVPPWVFFDYAKPVITLKHLLSQHVYIILMTVLHLVIVTSLTLTLIKNAIKQGLGPGNALLKLMSPWISVSL